MSVAIVPGSFDPITVGHLDIIKRALLLYDTVVVAVMNNAAKTYTFDLSERRHLAELATADLDRVRVVADEGLLVDLFEREGGDVIVKGVRNETDRAYEMEMAAYNESKNPRAKTVLLQASDDYLTVSSTVAREKLKTGEGLAGILPPAVLAYLGRGKQ